MLSQSYGVFVLMLAAGFVWLGAGNIRNSRKTQYRIMLKALLFLFLYAWHSRDNNMSFGLA